MKLSFKTDKGIKRKNNEDSLMVIPPWDNSAISRKACLFLVADGMGGQNAGEVASKLAAEYAEEWFRKTKFDELTTNLVGDLINSANEKVWNYSRSHPESSGMGTTFSIIIIKDSKAIIGHIGDSRVYRLRDNTLQQLTNDHSIVGEQVRLGKLTPNQARTHPTRGILSKVLGARQFIKADIFEVDLKLNDEFVLCSDGVYSMMDVEVIEYLIKNTSSEKLADTLVEKANSSGGDDNSTVVAFKLDELPIRFPSSFSLSRVFKFFSQILSK